MALYSSFDLSPITSHIEHLRALLDVVVHESANATNPDALIDYMELSALLTDLLNEGGIYSILGVEQLKEREGDVRVFAEKIRTVQEVVGDWDVRTKMSMPASRKRARSLDNSEQTIHALKRQRESDTQHNLFVGPPMNSPAENILPSIEHSPTAQWWTEPFYD